MTYLIPRVDIYLERDEVVYHCSGCGREYHTYDHSEPYTARDLPYGKWKSAWIHFEKVYVNCESCGVRVESLGWIDSRVRYTKRLADEVAWECRLFQSIKTVAERFHLHWKTVKEMDRDAIKGLMYLLYTRPGNLRRKDRRRLDEAFKLNRRLFTVYMLQEELSHLWSYTYEGAAIKWFQHWYNWAIRTRIKAVKNFARSLKAHLDGILAHCKHKISTSFLEGMNNKIKVIKRIAFGYRDFEYFFGENPRSLPMIYLAWSARNLKILKGLPFLGNLTIVWRL